MKKILNLVVFISSNLFSQSNWSPEVIFFDDFNGSVLNENLWHPNNSIIGGDYTSSADLNGPCTFPEYGCVVGGIGCSSADNIILSSSICELRATESFTNQCYVGWNSSLNQPIFQQKYIKQASLVSKRKFKYGTFEARIKIDAGAGFWPAFWMYGCDDPGIDNCGEIDVFEINTSRDDRFINNYHHFVNGINHQELIGFDMNGNTPLLCFFSNSWNDINIGSTIEEWHTYKVIWGPNFLAYYIDENLIRTINQDLPESMHIILNMSAYAGEEEIGNCVDDYLLRGSPNNTNLPKSFYIDYVKVSPQYTCGDLNFCTYFHSFGHDQTSYFARSITAGGTNCVFDYNLTNPIHAIDVMDFRAVEYIKLSPGFKAHNGSVFTAKIIPDYPGCLFELPITNSNIQNSNNQFRSLDYIQEKEEIDIKIINNPNTIGIFEYEFTNELSMVVKDNELKIYNINGSIIRNIKTSGQGIIDISDQPKGIYFALFVINNRHITKKLIIL